MSTPTEIPETVNKTSEAQTRACAKYRRSHLAKYAEHQRNYTIRNREAINARRKLNYARKKAAQETTIISAN